jgi:2-haloacid dehalogenase
MTITLAFDVYGTLIDTHGVVVELEKHIGNQAAAFSQTWRDKQLEYSFRRGLMQQYKDFSVCTRDAFEYTCGFYQVQLEQEAKGSILKAYKTLPAYHDVGEGLKQSKNAGYRLFAFSNGSIEMVRNMLSNAGLLEYFLDVVSVDEVKSFKPDPAVYQHFLKRAGTAADQTWLVSSNPFDIIGALACGMHAAWVQRSPNAVFDPWEYQPTITIESLEDLAQKIPEYLSA